MEQRSERKPAKAEVIYLQLKQEIENGDFMPGQLLSENMLVEHTGASRTPVREALRRLAADGLVDIAPRMAATVARISLGSVRELFDYRRILEPAAIRLAAGQAMEDPGVREIFTGLEAEFETLRGTGYSEEYAASFKELTSAFDEVLARSAANSYLTRSIRELRPHSARLRKIAHTERGRLDESLGEHIDMCRAVAAGDADRAAAALTGHLNHVEESILTALVSGRQGSPAARIDVGA